MKSSMALLWGRKEIGGASNDLIDADDDVDHAGFAGSVYGRMGACRARKSAKDRMEANSCSK